MTGFKRRDPVKLIDPEYHVVYIPAQDGNREYSDLVIYAKGLEKVEAPTNNPNMKQSQEKGLDQKQPSVDSKEKEKNKVFERIGRSLPILLSKIEGREILNSDKTNQIL